MNKLFPTIALASMMVSAHATTALIDFGRTDSAAPGPYNSAPILGANGSDVTTGAVALLDTESLATDWTVTVTETGSGNGGNAGAGADVASFPADLSEFETLAKANSIFANQGTGSEPSMVLLFSGLSPDGFYDLQLYGSRANAQGLDQRWSLTQGSGGADVDQNSELNATTYVDWVDITPNASGEIEVTINSPGPDMIGALALNFASITETSAVELISSFTTDTDTASPGNPATLSWTIIEPVDSLILDDGNGNTTDLAPLTTAGAGSTTVSPSVTTIYSITAVRGADDNVRNVRIISGEAPEILAFTSSADIIESGSSVDLSWSVAGATSLTLDPGSTDVTGTTTSNLSPTETTTYTITAANAFGSVTAEIPVEVLSGPFPTHRNLASGSGNADALWLDQISNRNWTMTGATRNSPLPTPSANTNINAAFTTTGGTTGGSTTSYQYEEITAEVWFRPGTLSADHQVIFETGGGQNGIAALITDSAIRLIGSTGDTRNLDVTISTLGLNLEDFLQLIITNNAATDEYTATVRDTFGNVRTVNETADVSIGVNGAGLFVWASGALGGASSLLGGSTDDPAAAPTGLTGFEGEIAILNIYDRILDETESQATFDRVATTTGGPAGLIVTDVSLDAAANELTITWNSINGQTYLVEFSTTLESDDWNELDDPFTATSDSTTRVLSLPPNRPKFFVRVVVDTP